MLNNPDAEAASGRSIPVAQYVRMSTEHQRYSTENQESAIAEYAALHSMRIIKTYADEGKSGLNIRGRRGFRQLLVDVQDPHVQFQAVLVYDISRWGRFLDPDQAASYEYACKQQGIQVIYCAEQFANDETLQSSFFKHLKRGMSAEYPRELSVKVFAGHRNLVQKGYRQGGSPGYGLRRQLIDESHVPKLILNRGEKKSIQSDRVLLIPGPSEEIATVHLVYELFLTNNMPESVIAAVLNRKGILSDLDRPWTRGTVHQILTNEKYIGNNVYNRTSFKLKIRHQKNAPSEWIRKNGAFEAIVPLEHFLQAQAIIFNRSVHMTDTQLLDMLKQLLERHGALSGIIIDEENGVPSSSAYRTRFGSLLQAYHLIGYTPKRDYAYLDINRALRKRHPELIAEITSGIEESGGRLACHPETDLLTVNCEFTLSVVMARCQPTAAGTNRWRIRLDASLEPDITIVARMAQGNQRVLDYYLLPSIDFCSATLPVKENNGFSLDAYRVDNLDFFYMLAGRVFLDEVT